MKILGNGAQCSWEAALGPYSVQAQPARKRLERAKLVASAVTKILEHGTSHSVEAAWWLTAKSLAQQLSYDCKVVPAKALSPLADELERLCKQSVNSLCAQPLTDRQWQQIQLPGPLGGCSLRLPSNCMDSSYVATWMLTQPKVMKIAEELRRPINVDPNVDDVMEAAARLKDHGVEVNLQTGLVHFTEEAGAKWCLSPWAADADEAAIFADRPYRRNVLVNNPKLLSKILRGVEALDAVSLVQITANKCDVHRLLSAGGPGTGKMWNLPPKARDFMPNDNFRMALNIRLGAFDVIGGSTCRMKRADNGEACNKQLSLEHTTLCKVGSAKLRPHRSLQHGLKDLIKKTGGFAELERNVPELYKKSDDGTYIEAILDVSCHFPASTTVHHIDLSVRSPFSSNLTDFKAGEAARIGEADKNTRYGERVLPLIFETFGRLGKESAVTLRMLSSIGHGDFSGGTRRANWRLKLERTLTFEITETIMICMV